MNHTDTPTKVLLVDDQPVVRRKYQVVLQRAGIEVETATNGAEALEMLPPNHDFDLVISDLNMPVLDGNGLVSEMRAMPRLELLPVLMLTASEDQDDCLDNLGAGVNDYVVKDAKANAELLARVKNLSRMKKLQDELERVSQTDVLTGLANRRHGYIRFEEEIERARRYQREFSVAIVDIDHFKRINDTLGHQAGDEVLVQVAAQLAHVSRQSDCVIRWGGEEFLFLFPETDGVEAVGIVERFRAHLADTPLRVSLDGGRDVLVTISGGVASLASEDTVETLVDRADKGLYRAKQDGRNRLLLCQGDQLLPVAS